MADMVEIKFRIVIQLLNSSHHFSLLLNNLELRKKYLNYLNILEEDLPYQNQLSMKFLNILYCKNRVKIENAKKY